VCFFCDVVVAPCCSIRFMSDDRVAHLAWCGSCAIKNNYHPRQQMLALLIAPLPPLHTKITFVAEK
jgi:hypothetical protein